MADVYKEVRVQDLEEFLRAVDPARTKVISHFWNAPTKLFFLSGKWSVIVLEKSAQVRKDAAICAYVAAHSSPLERGVEEIAAATAMSTTEVFLIAGASDRLRVRNIALGWHLVEENIGAPGHPLGFDTPWP